MQICYSFCFPFLVKGQKLPRLNVCITNLNWFWAKSWEKLNWLSVAFPSVFLTFHSATSLPPIPGSPLSTYRHPQTHTGKILVHHPVQITWYHFHKMIPFITSLRSAHLPRTTQKARPLDSFHPPKVNSITSLVVSAFQLPDQERLCLQLPEIRPDSTSDILVWGSFPPQHLPIIFLHSSIFQTSKCFTIFASAYFFPARF